VGHADGAIRMTCAKSTTLFFTKAGVSTGGREKKQGKPAKKKKTVSVAV
jgi:hypothetical protein